MLREFQFEDTEPRLLISLTISEDKELSDIKTPILPDGPFKCLSVYSHKCSLDLDKINLFKLLNKQFNNNNTNSNNNYSYKETYRFLCGLSPLIFNNIFRVKKPILETYRALPNIHLFAILINGLVISI